MFRATRQWLHHAIKRKNNWIGTTRHVMMITGEKQNRLHIKPLWTYATLALLGTTTAYAKERDKEDSVSEGATYLRNKILPFRESYRKKNSNDDVPLPRVRILKQGTSTYVASFAVGTDADAIAMISALIQTLQNSNEDIHIHTALPDDTLISFVLSGGEASVLLVRRLC